MIFGGPRWLPDDRAESCPGDQEALRKIWDESGASNVFYISPEKLLEVRFNIEFFSLQ